MDISFEGQNVVITGAAQGIGKATAHLFMKLKANLFLIDFDLDGLQQIKSEVHELDGKIEIFQCDLTSSEQTNYVLDDVIALAEKRIDVLVNNVGSGAVRLFDDLTDQDWENTMNLNFMSYVRTCRKILPVMRTQGKGVIINNASDLARQPESCPIDYSASKAAVLALTKGLARSEGPIIRINAVAPGPIWTPFWTKPGGFADTLSTIHKLPPQEAVEFEMKNRHLPLERLGTPEEVANVIIFLSSEYASFVTSSVWGVDGGSIRSII
ncbi:SDR family NAD(P)-dependent oxidoreductase [Acinetobacter pittii]|uniref:SDR family NAD(P)-dependent oxidoreductase n=1 Tax=Acinetobacter pittii TaxID=48296 RepID=UPI00388E3669